MKVITVLYFFLVIQISVMGQNRQNLAVRGLDSTEIIIDSSISLTWQEEIDRGYSLPLLVSGEKIFLSTKDGAILCFDLNGDSIWNYESGGTLISEPAAADNILAAGTAEGDLLSIDAESGEVIQEIGLGESVTSGIIIIDIFNKGIKSKGVIIGTSKGNLYCYDLYTFELIWGNNSAEDSIEGKIVCIKNRIIFGSRDNYLYCIDAKSGTINWKWRNTKIKESAGDNPEMYAITADEKNVYVIERQNNFLTGIDLLLGTPVWQKKDLKLSNIIGISGEGKKLFVPGASGIFYIISSSDGKVIREIKMDSGSERTYTGLIEWNNNILFGSSSGKIYLFDSVFNWKPVISLNDSVISVNKIKGNIFTASCNSGRIILFQIN
ncbi:MAG TPA: PQQ-binding-like beta-propeller repeat protein [Ignavibacteriaceae bacterium]|nr:PQQ-binding-like beta-propeller repeat protein [Ignavibacteriaceae bacterium]